MPDAATPTLEDALALGLTDDEYSLVCELHGGPPNVVELAMYSLLWSEHCAYKHSKRLLRTLPTEGPHVVLGPGENAGAVDVGDGLVCAFKVESHNHPSAVEPFEGAATGVGGILRDIFAIGARPIAVLDSLRFGEPSVAGVDPSASRGGPAGRDAATGDVAAGAAAAAGDGQADPSEIAAAARTRYLLDGAVSGIAHYGNSVGVPTIGGEVYFEGPYGQSCLVNAMALGIASRDGLVRSAAAGEGNVIVLFGASTGRDGIGGASVLASAELSDADEGKRPTVQVGDPFEGKKLLECSLELLERGLLVSLQDLGAAGLTSSAAEMASKGGVGVDIDVGRVPLREADMEPFEIMVSESQERMLCVVEPQNVAEVLAVCEKWDVNGADIGAVTASGDGREDGRSPGCRVRVLRDGQVVGDMPVTALVDDVPLYDLQPQRPQAPIYPPPKQTLPVDALPTQALLALLASPNIASRRPLFERYDAIVQSRTVRRPESADAAVLSIEPLGSRAGYGASRDAGQGDADAGQGDAPRRPADGPLPGLAASIDCNGRRVAADPYRGTVEAVLECAANLACVGAEPLGATNNLNFGNPEKPHTAWQLDEAVRGLGDACRALSVPIVGGNVSLYNESASGPIYPTPVIGMVGRLPDVSAACGIGFAKEGDAIALVGPFAPSLAASELAKLHGLPLPQELPRIDFPDALAAIVAVRDAVRSGVLSSAHDIAEGGLTVALAECCLAGGVGATVSLVDGMGAVGLGDVSELTSASAASPLATLFGEAPGGFLLSGPEQALRDLGSRTPTRIIGAVGGQTIEIDGGEAKIEVTLADAAAAHRALAELFS